MDRAIPSLSAPARPLSPPARLAAAFAADLKLAWRRLLRRRGLTAVAVATLAAALGASVVAFAVFSALLLHPLPYPQPAALVALRSRPVSGGVDSGPGRFSAPDYLDLRSQLRGELALAAYYPDVATLAGGSPPQHVAYANVSGNFFTTLGVAPALGRGLQPGDETPTLPQVAVLSNGLWRQRYAADPGVVGRGIDVDNRELTVVGVMPAGFDFPTGAALWTPEPFTNPLLGHRGTRFLWVVGRLPAPADLGRAQLQLNAVAAQLASTYPDSDSGQGAAMARLSAVLTAPFRATLWLLLVSGMLLFGVACANVANLLLAETVGRRREMAVRASLGAGRRRLIAQLLTEGLLLAAVAAGVGWILAVMALPAIRAWHPLQLPQLAQLRLDARVAGFALAVTLATGIWLGSAPAWEALRSRRGRSLQTAMREDGRQPRIHAWIAGVEIAATVLLLVTAGLLVRSARRLQAVDPGFNPAGVLTFRASLLYNNLGELDAGAGYFRQLDQRLQLLPGVAAAGLISDLPLGGDPAGMHFYTLSSLRDAALPDAERPQAVLVRVLPGYFATLQIPLRGRDFDDADTQDAARVVIVNQRLARDFFPAGDALGGALMWGQAPHASSARIVGIAGDVRQRSLAAPAGWQVYEPYLQSPVGDMSGVVRARGGDPARLLAAVKREAAALNPQIPLYEISTLSQPLAAATAPDRFRAALLLAVGGLALLLALAGVYSLLAHDVAQRQREIGVRMALGASAAQVRGMVLRRSLRLLLGGAAAGLAAAALLTRGLQIWLYGVRADDPLVFALVPLALVATGLLASLLPARHATQVDPAITLRCE